MPDRLLCPKCRGQRTTACSVCSGSGKRSIAGLTIGNCKECSGAGQRLCDACGGSGEIEASDTGEDPVSSHKFKIGQSVYYTSGPFGAGNATDTYKITKLLPSEGNDFQYKIKSAAEPYERVVKESQLNRTT